MCGIAGIISREHDGRVDESRLRRMRDVLTHRGPDGSGLIVRGPVGLAHTRLAIIDVARGEQPMSNENGDVWVVFNGEIYNHAELRPRLEARGHRYRTQCDTETIVHMYEEYGADCVTRLHGMFAFAIWDDLRQRLLLARDRLGIKPLYYSVSDREIAFASEIKALHAGDVVPPLFNDDVLPEYLATRFVSGDDTFFKGVQKLLPGHVLTWSPERPLVRRRYWQPPDPVDAADARTTFTAANLRERLEAAVSSHMMSDVPLGVFLSGGIDSSALAAMAAQRVDGPLKTFSVGFDDRATNELPFARVVADHIGAEHHDVTITPDQFFRLLPQALWHEDEPMAHASSVALNAVARLAREHVKVVLTGEGADELFLGYNRYRVTEWNTRLGTPYRALMPRALQRLAQSMTQAMPGRVGQIARRTFVGLPPGIESLYYDNFSVFSARWQSRVLREPARLQHRPPYATQTRYFDESSGQLLDRLSRAELQSYLLELLMKQDQMSMAASIESRVPFLDDQLVEYALSIPGAVKLPGWQSKALLRESVRDLLPPAIAGRRKLGFPVPLGQWLRTRYSPVVDEFVLSQRAVARGYFDRSSLQQIVAEHRAGSMAHTDRLWLLINLELWLRIFIDGETPADVMEAIHAHPVGETGRPVAANVWRPNPHRRNAVAAVAPARHHRADHARSS